MIYIDTSSLLKLIWQEAESAAVRLAVSREEMVVLSSLVLLEAEVRTRARCLEHGMTKIAQGKLLKAVRDLQERPPIAFRELSGTVFSTAMRQTRDTTGVHLRTLDRLHLAAMEELGARRIMTHDARLANAARELGFVVSQPC